MRLEEKWRKDVVTSAFSYANYKWVATEKNSFHGYDNDGILVNTPDITYSSEKYQCGWWLVNPIEGGYSGQ
jgi:hypothetical protein